MATVLTAIHADHYAERGLHIAIPGMLGVVGYILLITLTDKGMVAMYIAACITTIGVFSQIPAMLSWFSNNIGGHTKRGTATAIIVSLGNIGGAGKTFRSFFFFTGV